MSVAVDQFTSRRVRPTRHERHQRWMTALHRVRRALELRLAGASYYKIGDELGISESSARGLVSRAMARTTRHHERDVEKLRSVELMRLESMLHSLQFDVDHGSLEAIALAMKLSERRSKLLGLDAPVKIANTDAEGHTAAGPPALAVVFVNPLTGGAIGASPAVPASPYDPRAVGALPMPVAVDPIAQ
jgi:DNA-binding CsgD family transcriptional regulator